MVKKERAAVPAPEQKRVLEVKHPKVMEWLYLEKQLKTFDSYRKMVSGKGELPEEYKKLKGEWRQDRAEVAELEQALPAELIEEYAESVNKTEASVRQKYEEIAREVEKLKAGGEVLTKKKASEEDLPKEEPVLEKTPETELEGWKSLWRLGQWLEAGKPWPKNVTPEMVREQMKRYGLTQGKNTLGYAYWKGILERAKEAPAREEAETHRSQVQELEGKAKKLYQRAASSLKAAKEGFTGEAWTSQFKEEVEKAEKEVEPLKRGLGTRFKEGVGSFFNKFKREKPKEKTSGELLEETPAVSEAPVEAAEAETMEVEAETKEGAGEKEKKIAELREEIERLRAERDAKIKEREVGVIEQGKIEEEYRKKIAAIEEEIRKLEKPAGGPSVWGWIKERAKGVATGGLWEFGRATGFYLKTKGVGKESKAQAELLKQEKGLLLDVDEAWEEASEIDKGLERKEKDWIENYGADPKRARRLAVEFLSGQISARKREGNKEKENDMIQSALRKLEDKLKNKVWIGREYMAAHGGKMITPEKMALVEKRMRERISKIRSGQTRKDLVNFAKLYRESFDDIWWSRYIYGALEGIGIYAGWKWIVAPWLLGKGAAGAAAAEGGKEAVEYAKQTGLKDTIWQESHRLLERVGVLSPNDNQIQQVSEMMAKESGVKVVKTTGEILWPGTAGGAHSDIVLRRGFPLMLEKATKAALGIKTSLGL